jgi:hypothetical protein
MGRFLPNGCPPPSMRKAPGDDYNVVETTIAIVQAGRLARHQFVAGCWPAGILIGAADPGHTI